MNSDQNLILPINKIGYPIGLQSSIAWKSTLETGFLPQKFMIHFIKQPINTQKSFYAMSKNKQYTFDVDPRLTKSQVKKLFEKLFEVHIVRIQTHLPPRKKIKVGNAYRIGSTQKIKRVIFTLSTSETMKFLI